MAGSVNKVILVGNLGRDPEVKSMQDGRSMVNMSVATSDTWRDRQTGERKERTEWHRVVIFNEKLAEVAQKFVRKGSKIYVEGQLSTRKWTDQSGQERYTTEVVIPRFGGALTMLDGRGGGGGEAGAGGGMDDEMAGAPAGGRWRRRTPGRACRQGRARRRYSVLGVWAPERPRAISGLPPEHCCACGTARQAVRMFELKAEEAGQWRKIKRGSGTRASSIRSNRLLI